MFFRSLTAAFLIAGSLAVLPSASQAQEDQPLSAKQQDAVKKMIHDYIMENPSIIADAIEALRQKEELAADVSAKKAIVERKADIFEDPESPVLGNAKGDVTVVEFFDYRCPYCKAMTDLVLETVKTDGKVRLVMKELPILGPDSVTAARAALAARNQKKYEEFHRALMKLKGPINDVSVMKTAAEVGLNVEKLKKDMEDDRIDTVLKNNIQLAHALNISGTPGFVIGDQVTPGAMNQQALKQMIDQARKPKS
ncbi:DsbA family protein [Telmatospirillum sp.]|uniref:DsbA family protein n=1 Tax=Telmatospirillum sp. TaxID=2079197 RepID=UPI002842AF75|nr:DsbA family protein [Telmatospirillum sp.]MDR3439359.1 DsbA family protein [Telmatospirillum sp.]